MYATLRWLPHLVAPSALLCGVAVYLYARPLSVFFTGSFVTLPLAGQLPSFLHTLAFALAVSLVPGVRVIVAILAWGALELIAECLQHPAAPVPAVLEGYRRASTFDALDLVAIAAAVIVAIAVSACRWRARVDEPFTGSPAA